MSHNNTPVVNKLYMLRESDFVSPVFNVNIAWGKNDAVVNVAAIYPNISVIKL